MLSPTGNWDPDKPCLICQRESRNSVCALGEVGSSIGHTLWTRKTSQVNLPYPVSTLGSRKARKGQLEHATYSMSFESYIGNTGDLMKDAKEGGK